MLNSVLIPSPPPLTVPENSKKRASQRFDPCLIWRLEHVHTLCNCRGKLRLADQSFFSLAQSCRTLRGNRIFFRMKSLQRQVATTSRFTIFQRRAKKQKRMQALTLVKVRGPARRNPEIPILCVLSRSPKLGLRCKFVREQVKRKYYPILSGDDLEARYQNSGKKVTDSVIKFAKKHLVLKGQVYAIGPDCEMGTWKITPQGVERLLKEENTWIPKYSEYFAYVPIEEDEEGDLDDYSTE